MKEPKIAVIVLNYNGYNDTQECLRSIQNQKYRNLEIILVDNASSDGSPEKFYAECAAGVHCIFNKKNLGCPGGNNVGIQKALEDKECEYIFFLNNDAILGPNALNILVEAAQKAEYASYGSFQAKILSYYNRNKIDSVGINYSSNSLSFNRGSLESASDYVCNQEIFGCCFAAVLCKRSVVEALIEKDGYFFDEDFFLYAEDLDASFRLQWRGWRNLYVANAIAYHKGGGATQATRSLPIYYSRRNELYVMAKNLPMSFFVRNFFKIAFVRSAVIFINFLKRRKVGFLVIKATLEGVWRWNLMRKKGFVYRKNKKEWNRMEALFVSQWFVGRKNSTKKENFSYWRTFYRWTYYFLRRMQNIVLSAVILPAKKKKKKVLVVLANKIGDFIIFSPSLKYIQRAYPGYSVSVLTDVSVKDLAAAFREIDEFIPLQTKKFQFNFFYAVKFFLQIRRMGFSVVLYPVYSRSFTGDELVFASGAIERVGFRGDDSNLDQHTRMKNDAWYTRLLGPQPDFAKGVSEVERCRYFCQQLGVKVGGDFVPTISLSSEESMRGIEILKQNRWSGGRYVVMNPGAGLPYRSWPAAKFSKVVEFFVQNKLAVVFAGGQNEKHFFDDVTKGVTEGELINMIGKTTLLELGSVLKGAALYFGSDTGTVHLAAAVGTPTVCLLGGGYFDRFFPYGDLKKNRIVYDKNMKCKYDAWACARTVPFGQSAPCIDGITIDDAIEEIKSLLSCPER